MDKYQFMATEKGGVMDEKSEVYGFQGITSYMVLVSSFAGKVQGLIESYTGEDLEKRLRLVCKNFDRQEEKILLSEKCFYFSASLDFCGIALLTRYSLMMSFNSEDVFII